MNSTANWPLFATSAPVDSRIELIGPQSNFTKLMAQSNTSNEKSEEPDDLSSHLNKHLQNQNQNQNQIYNQNLNQNPFNHLKNSLNNNNSNEHNIKTNNNNINNSNNSNTGSSDATNGEVLNLRIDDSREDEFDDEDSLIDSIGDDDSLPSPDAMYATSYMSNDSNERNDTNKDDIGSEGQSIGEHSPIGPLAQLQNALERHSGMLGMSLTDFAPTNGTSPSLFGFGGNTMGSIGTAFNVDSDITGELYRCHLCSYSGTSKCQFNAHMNTHFDHKCPFCDYKSRTEGRLKRHIRDFHSEVPPESWAGNRVLKENSRDEGEESVDATDAGVNGSGGNSKNRKYKCKQCEFVATCKQEFWDHSKAHIKSEKLLTCPKCNFVTEYKHHLEYHLRNHFGSKPFKCAKCNYSCVNKSMLNSHMKSHSNIYQYRCADCSYATKYCHSLKLHLRKYQHKPATVLNLDGTPNPYPVIDVYGTRRGPRPKKSKTPKCSQNNQKSQQLNSSLPQTPLMSSPLSPNMMNSTPIPPLIPTSMPMGLPFMYPPNPALLHSGLLGPQIPHLSPMAHSLYDSPTIANMSSNTANSNMNSQNHSDPSAPNCNSKLKCNFCDFSADTRELFGKHLLLHVAAENQDICKMYGMTPSAEMLQQNAIISELAARQSPDSRRLLEQIAVNPSFINTLLGMHSMPKPEHPMALDWHSTQDSNTNQRRHGLSPEPILALTDGDHNRPESAPVRPNSKSCVSPLPRSRSSPTDTFDCLASVTTKSNSKQLSSESTPLDLSSNKSSSPLTQPFEPKISILTQQLTQTLESNGESVSMPGAQEAIPAPEPQQQSRAQRRKGRASKLVVNRCVKMNDQSLKCDDMEEEMSEDTADSVPEEVEEPDVDHIITKINNATNLLQEILIDMYSLKNDAYH